MKSLFRHLRLALFCAVFAVAAQNANAGTLTIDLTIGATTISIFSGSPFAQVGPDPNSLNADTAALNLFINSVLGVPGITFTSLGARSNNTGDVTAQLTQSGDVSLAVGAAPVSFTTVAYQNDFISPVGIGTMSTSATANYANTPVGNTSTFQSFFDQTNTNSMTTPSGIVNLNSTNLVGSTAPFAGAPAPTGLGTVNPSYALVNRVDVNLVAAGSGGISTNSYSLKTIVTTVAVPEPASVVMTLSALPLALGLVRRIRKGLVSR